MLHFECFCVKLLNLITHQNGNNLIAFFLSFVLRSGSLRFQRAEAFNWFDFFFEQDQGQSKESAKPCLIYSNKAKASARLKVRFICRQKNQSQCKISFNLFKQNFSQCKASFNLLKPNLSQRNVRFDLVK